MGEERVVDGELLEAEGDPANAGEKKGGEADKPKGFPPPDELEKEWSGHAEKAGLKGKGEEEVFKAWVAFCKQNRYPHPYPYPYPKPQAGARMRQIVELVDRLLKGETEQAFAAVTISSRASVASLSEYSTACCLNRMTRQPEVRDRIAATSMAPRALLISFLIAFSLPP